MSGNYLCHVLVGEIWSTTDVITSNIFFDPNYSYGCWEKH